MGKLGGSGGKYGPPKYDYSRKPQLKARIKKQALYKKPVLMYSSKWQTFGQFYLRNNPLINRELRKLASRALFQMRQDIPIGEDGSDGHLRDQIRVVKKPRGGYRKDRDTYLVGGFSNNKTDRAKWNAAVKRSSYHSRKEWEDALKAARGGGRVPYGNKKSWVNSTADKINKRG